MNEPNNKPKIRASGPGATWLNATVNSTISPATVPIPRKPPPTADVIARYPSGIKPIAQSGGTAIATD